jgi:hypothetical protein
MVLCERVTGKGRVAERSPRIVPRPVRIRGNLTTVAAWRFAFPVVIRATRRGIALARISRATAMGGRLRWRP